MDTYYKPYRNPSLVKYEYFEDDDLLDDSLLEARKELLEKYHFTNVKIKVTKQNIGRTYEFRCQTI